MTETWRGEQIQPWEEKMWEKSSYLSKLLRTYVRGKIITSTKKSLNHATIIATNLVLRIVTFFMHRDLSRANNQ